LLKEIEDKASQKVDRSIQMDGIEKRLDLMVESSFWDRVHEKCIGCGVCTFLCPTCHCFDITDEAVNQKGQRVRNWDSCLFPIYSLETSGHNPRPTGRERTRQRLMHKFNYFPKNFGRVACVGCGRCIIYCPVQFDIREVLLYASAKRAKGLKGKFR
jgi:ferredoxin